MPEHLTEYAKGAWPGLCDLLHDMGVLTLADAHALERLCECYADLRRAQAELDILGSTTYTTRAVDGTAMYRHYPQVKAISDADRRFRVWLAAFGLTPSDRSRVSAAAGAAKNPFEDL